jgi:hypothetical protein
MNGKVENEEHALAHKVNGICFKGNCRICGKKGHKAGDCWENKRNESKRPDWYKPGEKQDTKEKETRTCNYCKKPGHLVKDCFKLKNKEKKSEAAELVLVGFDGVMEDYALVNFEAKSNANLRDDIFIADSAATSHMKKSLDGMYDLVEWKVPVTMGNKMQLS